MNHFFIFGTYPELSLAEVQAVLPNTTPVCVNSMALLETSDWDGQALQDRLGGITKLGDVIETIPLEELTSARLADVIDALPRADKVVFSLSVFGANRDIKPFQHLGMQLKRELQERGKSVRWFAGDKGEVSPAAVAKLHLTNEGYDFCLAIYDKHAAIGLTTHVQDADAWGLRDFGRPFRDATTGMLPPKLAHIMVNLGIGNRTTGNQPDRKPSQSETLPQSLPYQGGRLGVSSEPPPDKGGAGVDFPGAGSISETSILDPFCGGGTILMEAAMIGCEHVIGSDADKTQIKGTQENMEWLAKQGLINQIIAKNIPLIHSPVETLGEKLSGIIDAIVSEGHLGKPLQGNEPRRFLEQQKTEIETLWANAFATFAKLQKTGGRVVCIWPTWKTARDSVSVDATASAKKAGYHLIGTPIAYSRPGQHVERKIVVPEKQ
jgi:tRNA G10  N-methylase Trm11